MYSLPSILKECRRVGKRKKKPLEQWMHLVEKFVSSKAL
jgi:hypothetical protein